MAFYNGGIPVSSNGGIILEPMPTTVPAGTAYIDGWALDPLGYAYYIDVGTNSLVGVNVEMHAGCAFSQTGALYITTDTTGPFYIASGGFKVRYDGAVLVSSNVSTAQAFIGGMGRSPTGALFLGTDSVSFAANLQNTLVPLSAGDPTPTYTRASAATHIDFENAYRQVLSGEPRFQGAARYYNEYVGSAALGTQGNTVVAGTYAVSFTGTGTITFSGANVGSLVGQGASITVGAIITTTAGTLTSTVSGTVTNAMLENRTGASNQNPAPFYVDSATAYGAGVNSVQYDSALNASTITGGVLTRARGATIAAGVSGVNALAPVDAGGPLGYLSEGAGTQILATADIRDMTTANWTLGATMTRARTSIGADGAANSATRLTGGAAAATNIITTTITAAATSRTYSALVRRITGTGPVRLTQDNFATNTDISGSLVAGQWVLVQLNQSQLNAVMGIKIDTNGDAVDVDFNQFEAGAVATSRMAATGAARAADVLTYPSAGNVSNSVGSVYYEGMVNVVIGVANVVIGDGGSIRALAYPSSGALYNYDGTNNPNFGTPVINSGVVNKIAQSWSGVTASAYTAGSSLSNNPVTFNGNYNFSAIGVGAVNGAVGIGTSMFGTVRNVRIYPTALPASRLQAMTT